MKNLLGFVPLYTVVCLILGLLLQYYCKIWRYGIVELFGIIASLLLLLFILHTSQKRLAFGVTYLISIIALGISSLFLKNPQNYPNYFIKYMEKNGVVYLRIQKVLRSTDYYDKYLAKVERLNGSMVSGTVLLNIQKETNTLPLQTDNRLQLIPTFTRLPKTLNPYQFSYKDYLSKQGVYYQIHTKTNKYRMLPTVSKSLFGLAETIRNWVKERLHSAHLSADVLQITNAFLLGEKQFLSKDIRNSYRKAGVIHILAISGLHVGIIFLLLQRILSLFGIRKRGSTVTFVFTVGFLWFFALITGLSASVVRAVTMFTFIAIGEKINRQRVPLYAILNSMFFILLFHPYFIFDIGFQLSYIVVFAIVLIQPKLVELWKPKGKITQFYWKTFTVTLAAQIGITPISLYYFQETSLWSIFTNMVVVPWIGILVYTAILLLVITILKITPGFLTEVYNFLISAMNSFIAWIASIQNNGNLVMSLNIEALLLWYLLLIILFGTSFKTSFRRLVAISVVIITLQTCYILDKINRENKKELILFHKNKLSVIGIRNGNKIQIHHNMDTSIVAKEKFLSSYRIHENITMNYTTKLPRLYAFDNKTFIWLDKKDVNPNKKVKNAIIILRNSPKINLERILLATNL
ncbi:ComEC/Rec2 family competence protein [Tenacibaculum sp. SG-28]|uniref:ComEC/Rec2 family competence protein n=1 Tax=Tenacibaculum sp. SG-28 TaxID=754426 RepID=UPI000CF4EDD1|nr:ComEC/Rec2 family competence protein [Tenacibaculum sp. SG-28]PQJ21485.1 hypothetical protein BSU00_04960 [Tenacibaculum sp. SG-28]